MKPSAKLCAIYVRKSSEEGLEQEFNSLDAQRESCEAYIQSQKSDGWSAIKERYDDGGFSGGNMDRPGLKKLMSDIQAGKVNIVVVYKIDRLTRSLMDFAKLVEIFDRHNVTFVSVTQAFSTTTSMGRLTLNVLLSFAQFEREVTGERIRDKVSASKKKGMWMGGMTPFGYDCVDKKLLINQQDAQVVRIIFEKYVALGSVRRLKEFLDASGICSKLRTSSMTGKQWGGSKFSRGLLYKLLTNPVYIGRIKHKNAVYDGQHEALLSQELWDTTQALMAQRAATDRGGQKSVSVGNLLKGLLLDAEGNKYSPSFANKGQRQYRYYVSQALLQDRKLPAGIITRLSAPEAETAIEDSLRKELQCTDAAKNLLATDCDDAGEFFKKLAGDIEKLQMRRLIIKVINKIVIDLNSATVFVDRKALLDEIARMLNMGVKILPEGVATIVIPVDLLKPRTDAFVVEPKAENGSRDPFDLNPQELKNWVRGVIWRDRHFSGTTISQIAQEEHCSEAWVSSLIAQSFTAA